MEKETWQNRLNLIINGYLTIGLESNDAYEWINEEDMIEMRDMLRQFIAGLLKDKDQEINDSIKWERDADNGVAKALASQKEKMLGIVNGLPTVTKSYADETSLYVKVSDIKKKIGGEL